MNIGVIGLGKLGLPFALTMAHAGHRVLVYDTNPEVRELVRMRKAYIDEPEIPEMMAKYHLEVASPDEMGQTAHVVFIIVPTPSNEDSTFDNSYILDALNHLPSINHQVSPRVVSIVSTVSPGSFTGLFNLVDVAAARGWELVYTPTLIALGSVVHNLVYPDVQIVGGQRSSHGVRITTLALQSMMSGPIVEMDYESAAICKLASNVFVTLKIGFANTLAHLCDHLGGDVDLVTKALGHNKRIGDKALTAGAGYGGPCFPRDAAAFSVINTKLPSALLGYITDELNRAHLDYITDKTIELAVEVGATTFCVFGRAYKDNSSHTIESFGDKLSDRLEEKLEIAVVDQADIVVVAQPMAGCNLTDVLKNHAVVYDLWRAHTYLIEDRKDVTYFALGKGEPDE